MGRECDFKSKLVGRSVDGLYRLSEASVLLGAFGIAKKGGIRLSAHIPP